MARTAHKETEILENMSIRRAVLTLAVPTVISQLIVMVYNLADTWFPLGGRGNTQTLFDDDTIASIAAAHGKSSAQIILRWHLQAGNIAIPGSGNEVHIAENYDFPAFSNVDISCEDPGSLSEEQLSVLVTQARYCQAMTEADLDALREIVSEDMTFTHMSGLKQTREEYFADIVDGSLDYHRIGIENPVIEIEGDRASITYTSVLNANAYGAEGTYRIYGTHCYELRDGAWVAVNR